DFSEVIKLEDYFVEGEMFSAGSSQVVLGKRLADLMKLRTGDYITLLVKDKHETFNTIEAEIAGLVHTGHPLVNQGVVYLPLDLAQRALDVGDQVSKILVRLEEQRRAPEVAKALENQLKAVHPQLKAFSWDQLEAVSVAGAKQMGN